jgi:hypothetical protein
MQTYRHTQKASAMLWVLGGAVLLLAGLGTRTGEGRLTVSLVAAVLVVIIVLFSSLTVEVTESELRLFFGPGLIRKTFRVAEIRDGRLVTNPWYYGWGIHMTPHGWLFNVAGFDAVEVTFDSGRKVRIGSDEPNRLLAAIRQATARV